MNNLEFNWQKNSLGSSLFISGDLVLNNLPIVLPTAELNLNSLTKVIINCCAVTQIDTSGANALILAFIGLGLSKEQIVLEQISSEQENIFKLVNERSETKDQAKTPEKFFLYRWIYSLGISAEAVLKITASHITLLGHLISILTFYLFNPKKIRSREIFSQLEQTGIQAIPVVMLVTFLIGIVVSYLLAMQAEKFGASIFVVDGVALAMCREMSPILVAIILAGRSGSAFTAQLGAMKLTEEIDALKSIGLNSFDVLIFPRIFSLLVALPLLVFIGDIVGMFGGMLVTDNYLNLTSTSFMQRLEQVLTLKHVLVGLIKAPVFALAIGLIACRVGMEVEKDARSVGLSTTKTVVRSIVVVILMNAAFTVVFANLGF